MSNPSGRFAIVHFINVVHIGAKPYDTLRNSDFVIYHSDLFVQFFDRKTGDELANTPITNCSSWRHMTIAEVDSDDAERAALMGMQSLKLELVSQKEAIDNLVLADALNSSSVNNTVNNDRSSGVGTPSSPPKPASKKVQTKRTVKPKADRSN